MTTLNKQLNPDRPSRRKAKRREDNIIVCTYGKYTLYLRNGVWYADTRGSIFPAGRISLGTRDLEVAIRRLDQLDHNLAIKFGRLAAPAAVVDQLASQRLLLNDGWTRYITFCGRPAALGGVSESTLKRYRAVQAKHEAFAQSCQIATWQQVDDRHVLAYAAYLEKESYSDATLVLEIDLIKSVIKWLVGENILPPTARIKHATQKSEESTRYCYTREQVQAMLDLCWTNPALHWLHDVLLFLALTGARVGELRNLPWSMIDLDAQIITFVDNRGSALAKKAGAVRKTKGKRGRRVPIHPLLETMLRRRHAARGTDTVVFRGPEGGQLNPDGVLVALKRDVIKPLVKRFPTPVDEIGFEHGTTHSLRHVFVSQAFLAGANESEIGDWVGHKSSRITRRYRHLGQQDSIRRMRQLDLLASTPSKPGENSTESNSKGNLVQSS